MHRRRLMQKIILMGGITPWYSAGGIPAPIAAYQPKGATSYAASKISLVNPSAANLLTDGAAFPTWAAATGWTFTAASLQYLTIGNALVTAAPISIVARATSNDVVTNYHIFSICDTAGGSVQNYFDIAFYATQAGDPFLYYLYKNTGPVSVLVETTTGFTASTAYTLIGASATSASHAAYINGGSKGTSITACVPDGLDTTYIGCFYNGDALTGYLDGTINALAVYNIALSDAQVLAIHNAMVTAGL